MVLGESEPKTAPDRRSTAVVVDDHNLMAHVTAARVTDIGFDVIAVATTFADGLAAIKALNPDVSVIDYALDDDRTGVDIVRALPDQSRRRVLIVTATLTPNISERVGESGASGAVEKTVTDEQFAAALRAAARA